MKGKYKNLIKNTSIFALGTFGSKILVFLIVPLYTYVLSSSDYGKIDLITSSVNLFIPFTTLLIYEAAIRFLIAKECDEKNVFNNCFMIFIIGCVFSIFISPIILVWLNIKEYCIIFVSLLILTNYTTIFGQYLRATGDNWGFSISGIITTLSTVILNLILLLVFKKGINGYLYSLIISQLITGIFIFIKCKTLRILNYKYINIKILKSMIIYSIPLVPNNIMWWIMNAGDKYVINYFLGTAANGIFSISYKIPTILTMLFSIFMQAWQVSAIEERQKNLEDDFYKKVFKYIFFLLILMTAIIIIFVQPIFEIIIGNEFISSWQYVPLLCIATLFNCFSTFAGVVYLTEKESKKSFYTTFIGALTNLIFNFLLIRNLGLFGVSIGTTIGYIIVMILRFRDYKKYFEVSLMDFEFITSMLILIVDSLVYMFINGQIKYVISAICLVTILFISRRTILGIIEIIKNKLKYNNYQNN